MATHKVMDVEAQHEDGNTLVIKLETDTHRILIETFAHYGRGFATLTAGAANDAEHKRHGQILRGTIRIFEK